MSHWLTQAWYRGHPALYALWPLSFLYARLSALRRFFYAVNFFSAQKFSVPIIVVGNITVGGTGKTPLTLALIDFLKREGFSPAVVSRGYGGHADYPLHLTALTTPQHAGDEPVTIFQRTGVPVVVDPKRARAVQYLLQNKLANVVICDDGLQHYALARDLEIAVIDGARGMGNGWFLPAGPLREAEARLNSVDFVVINGTGFTRHGAHTLHLKSAQWKNLHPDFDTAPAPEAKRIHAVAGIGNPARFFTQLRAQGFQIIEHAFPDHHAYTAADINFGDDLPVVMTEKDAVKCVEFVRAAHHKNYWAVPVNAELPADFYASLLQKLNTLSKKGLPHVG